MVDDHHLAELAHAVGEAHLAIRHRLGAAARCGGQQHRLQGAALVGTEGAGHPVVVQRPGPTACRGGQVPGIRQLLGRRARGGSARGPRGGRARRAAAERHLNQLADPELGRHDAGVGRPDALGVGAEATGDGAVGVAGPHPIAIGAAGGRPLIAGGHQQALTHRQVTGVDAGIEALQTHQRHPGAAGDLPQGVATLDGHPLAGDAVVRTAIAAVAGTAGQQQRQGDQQPDQRWASRRRSLSCHRALSHDWKRSL